MMSKVSSVFCPFPYIANNLCAWCGAQQMKKATTTATAKNEGQI